MTRTFAPLTLLVVTAIFALSTESAHAQYVYRITYDQLQEDTQEELQDGDKVKVVETRRTVGDMSKIYIALEHTNQASWWKGIQLFIAGEPMEYELISAATGDKVSAIKTAVQAVTGSSRINVAQGEKREGLQVGVIDPEWLKTHLLVLSKAKQFGVHTNMYWLTDAAKFMKPGHEYRFVWQKD